MSKELDTALTTVIADGQNEPPSAIGALLQPDQYVGEVFYISYETANVQIHDYQRRQVGGIPALSFLLASRLPPAAADTNPEHEDSCAILLRVMDAVPLPDSRQAEETRVETARAVSGDTSRHWDSDSAMDADTRVLLGYAGVGCRILGTFFLEEVPATEATPSSWVLRFGSDISNYYPNRGLKVYKPVGDALTQIVNYIRPSDLDQMLSQRRVSLGSVRYASTDRRGQGVDEVPVRVYPADLLDQKTAVFGMTRTGKSNTLKIIAQSIFDLRTQNDAHRIGQLIFDSNGEYANENVQDSGALKNIWRQLAQSHQEDDGLRDEEIATYGIEEHPNDKHRKLMRLNFFRDSDLQTGKGIINDLMTDVTAQYARAFCNVTFSMPDQQDGSQTTRYRRQVLCYRALLYKAGFAPPPGMLPNLKSLFSKEFRTTMAEADPKGRFDFKPCAEALARQSTGSWADLAEHMNTLREFLATDAFKAFDQKYIAKSTHSWADESLRTVLDMFKSQNRPKLVARAMVYHSSSVDHDYADSVYKDLTKGKLVIVDQSTGDPKINRESADRIVARIFRGNQGLFRQNHQPPHIVVFIEEAHNQLPSDRDTDASNIWVRTAKEGAKFHIGMVYATQEVSSIQRNMLKNTANWFIGHLNNTDETKELRKYYDFVDFERSILRAQDTGFLRVKTLSNPFVVPVQVRRFDAPPAREE